MLKFVLLLSVSLLVRGELRKASQLLENPVYEDEDLPAAPEDVAPVVSSTPVPYVPPALPSPQPIQTTTPSPASPMGQDSPMESTPSTTAATTLIATTTTEAPRQMSEEEGIEATPGTQVLPPPGADVSPIIPSVHVGPLPTFPSVPVQGGERVRLVGRVNQKPERKGQLFHKKTVEELNQLFEQMHQDQVEEADLHLANPLVQTLMGLAIFTIIGLGGSGFVIYALCLTRRGSYTLPTSSDPAPLAREMQEAIEEMERESPLYVAYKEEGELDKTGRTVPGSIRRSARVQRRPKGWNSTNPVPPAQGEPGLPPPPACADPPPDQKPPLVISPPMPQGE